VSVKGQRVGSLGGSSSESGVRGPQPLERGGSLSTLTEYSALCPFLLVAVRVLYLAANNPGDYGLDDLIVVLAIMLAGTGLVYLVARTVLRKSPPALPGLVTLVTVAWISGAPTIYHRLPESLQRSPHYVWIAGIVISSLAIRSMATRPRALSVVGTFLTNVCGVLAVWLVVDIGHDQLSSSRALGQSELIRELAQPVRTRSPDGSRTPQRDIYVIVLDEYANDAVLRRVLNFDNSAFEDSLRALGFYIPRFVRSNYTQTSLSLAAFLNAAHVDKLRKEVGRGNDASIVNYIVDQNRVGRYLRAHGYRFVFFPSSWWFGTHGSTLADSVVRVEPPFDPGRELSRTDFRRVIWHTSMLWWFYRTQRGDDAIIRNTFRAFSLLPTDPRPIFGLAHIISPHGPYVFDSQCRAREHEYARNRDGYVGQLQCVNRLVLETVTELLRRSGIPPIIILQGDHGTAFLDYSGASTASGVNLEAAGERFSAFGAYFLPGSGATVFGDTVAVVNVLGRVLWTYAGADLPMVSDEQYLSIDRAPFDMYRVEPQWPASRTADTARQ